MRTLVITVTMIDRIAFWVSQFESQFYQVDTTCSELKDAQRALRSLERVVLDSRLVYADEAHIMRVFFGKPELEVVRDGSMISD